MSVVIVVVSECGMFRSWRLAWVGVARARWPVRYRPGPVPAERSTPSFSFPSVAAIHLTDTMFQLAFKVRSAPSSLSLSSTPLWSSKTNQHGDSSTQVNPLVSI